MQQKIIHFFKTKMPILEFGTNGYHFLTVHEDKQNSKRIIGREELSGEENTEQNIALLEKVLENGYHFYCFTPNKLENYLEGTYEADFVLMPEVSDWLGTMDEEYEIYLYKFTRSQFSLEAYLKEPWISIDLIDIERKVFVNWSKHFVRIVANTKVELKAYLELLSEA